MRIVDLAWAAGFLEGEGSFVEQRKRASVTCVQVQREPLERLTAMVGGAIYLRPARPFSDRKAQDAYVWVLGGTMGVGLMMTLYPLMSPKRKDQIRNVLVRWRASRGHRAQWTHCASGHPYSAENTNIDWRGARQCKICYQESIVRKVNKRREQQRCA